MISKNKIYKAIYNPNLILRKVWQKSSRLIKNDKIYLSVNFFLSHKKKMHWDNPKTFNEKTTWLKLWSKNKGFEKYVDKYEVRKFIAEKIGEEYLVPIYGVWDSYDDIDFRSLPDKYVLKTTHDSGGVKIITGQPTESTRKFFTRHMASNYFLKGREYPYKKVAPRIMAEKFMVDESCGDLKDYKFFCFNGEPRILFLASERFKDKNKKAKFDYFDIDRKKLPFESFGHESLYKPGDVLPDIPEYDEMLRIAKILSTGFPFIRIDFYNINGKIYVGEMTFFHDDGVVPFSPKEWDYRLGEMITLPES